MYNLLLAVTIMETISASKLRNNLFDYLEKVANGETIIIQRHKQEIAQLIPSKKIDWRDLVGIKVNILVPFDELIAPMDDVWEDYV